MRQMAMNLVETCNSWNKISGLRGNLNFLQSQLEDKINRDTDFVSLLKRSNTAGLHGYGLTAFIRNSQ